MKKALKHIGVFLLWNLVVGFFLLYVDPQFGLPAALGASYLLLRGYLLRPPADSRADDRWAMMRLRPLTGATLRWTAVAVPVLLVLSWAFGDVYTHLVPVPPETLNPFERILGTRAGRLSLAVFAIAVVPIVEEFVFRGLVQGELERRFGAIRGIAIAAALFAVVHFLPWVLPVHFFLGVAFGFAVWATRSIWTGVVLHAANNCAALIGFAATGNEPVVTGTLWEVGITADLWTSVLVLIVAAFAGAWTAGKLLQAGREADLPGAREPFYLP